MIQYLHDRKRCEKERRLHVQWREILPSDDLQSTSSPSASFATDDVAAEKSRQLSTSYDGTALPSFQKYRSTVRVRTTLTSALISLAKRRASVGPFTAATDPVIPSRMRGRLEVTESLISRRNERNGRGRGHGKNDGREKERTAAAE